MQILVMTFAALLIGVSKAGFGGGTGVLVGPVLALMFPAKDSVGLMLPLLFVCDVASLYAYWGKWDKRNVIGLLPGAVVGIAVGALALHHVSDYALTKIIGVLAIVFSFLQAWRDWIARSEKPLEPGIWLGTLIGFATGFISTLSHIGGVVTTVYLLLQRLDNERFVGTTTAVYFLINLLKIPVFVADGILTSRELMRGLPYIPLVLLGTALGVYLNRRVSGKWFSRVVFVSVLVTGIKLLLDAPHEAP